MPKSVESFYMVVEHGLLHPEMLSETCERQGVPTEFVEDDGRGVQTAVAMNPFRGAADEHLRHASAAANSDNEE